MSELPYVPGRIDPTLIYDVKTAAEAIGVGPARIRLAIRNNELRAYTPGRRTKKIKGSDLQSWFDGLPTQSANTGSCPQRTGGSHSGTSPVQTVSSSERGHASASRDLRHA